MNFRRNTQEAHEVEPIQLKPNWSDRIKQTLRHSRHFGWDLLGTFLLLITILSLLGLFGISRGVLITPWVSFLRQGLGWGSYLLLAGAGYFGVACFLYNAGKISGLPIGRVLALEVAFFCLLPLLTVIGGGSLDRAMLGLDGGTIGWGLMNLFWPAIPLFLVGFFFTVLTVVFLLIGSDWVRPLYHHLLEWSETVSDGTKLEDEPELIQSEAPAVEEAPAVILSAVVHKQSQLPPLNLLLQETGSIPDEVQIRYNAHKIEKTLNELAVPAKVIGYRVGPTVTQYAVEPGFIERNGVDGNPVQQKVRVSQIANLKRDLALALSATSLRIETPVPGRSYVGIEVPNSSGSVVRLRSILESNEFRKMSSPLGLALGKNVSGEAVVGDLEKMPHLLIAGTTNSGKSVCITAITACLVMNNAPSDLRLVMLDPKMVELVRYNGLPHLLGKVETEVERMLAVLRWALVEMDTRYRTMAAAHVRDLKDYNLKMVRKKEPTLPHIVILIDELADLMMSAPDQTEHSLVRLAQMARATGIHLVVATQRPSADVVTGLIKANFPARIAFLVASSVDSRVILDANGAESLLGKGDMLFDDPQKSGLQRAQGVLVSDQEIEKIISHWQKVSEPSYEMPPWENLISESQDSDSSDDLIEHAVAVVKTAGKASISLLQRRMRIGYPRAARLIDQLEEMGIVGPSVGSGKDREVLIGPDEDSDLEQD
jgi:S-DNA-T family DNA segregation ATPase FtsK/SpoIIIE